jgi:hypothetical protein
VLCLTDYFFHLHFLHFHSNKMAAGTGAKSLSAHHISDLPTSVSIRHGAHAHMTAHGISHLQQASLAGHRECFGLPHMSSHWDYQPFLASNVISACMPLAGWHSRMPGVYVPNANEFIGAPQPPSLECLFADVTKEKLDIVCDLFLQIRPDKSPQLAVGGRLRALPYAMLASALRFFPDLEKICDKSSNQNKTVAILTRAFAAVDGFGDDTERRLQLIRQYGARVVSNFMEKNARFFFGGAAMGADVSLVEKLQATLTLMHGRIGSAESEVALLRTQFRQEFQQVKSDLRQISDTLLNLTSIIGKLCNAASPVSSTPVSHRHRAGPIVSDATSSNAAPCPTASSSADLLLSDDVTLARESCDAAPSVQALQASAAALKLVGKHVPKLSGLDAEKICADTKVCVWKLFAFLISAGISFKSIANKGTLLDRTEIPSTTCDRVIAAQKMFRKFATSADLAKLSPPHSDAAATGAVASAQLESVLINIESKLRKELTLMSELAVCMAGDEIRDLEAKLLQKEATMSKEASDHNIAIRLRIQTFKTAITALSPGDKESTLTVQSIADKLQSMRSCNKDYQWRDQVQCIGQTDQPTLSWGKKRSATTEVDELKLGSKSLETSACSANAAESVHVTTEQPEGIIQSIKNLFS